MVGKFEFIGFNGSLGFVTGKTYVLDVSTSTNIDGEYVIAKFSAREMGGSAMVRCPYGSWNAFFLNWKPLAEKL